MSRTYVIIDYKSAHIYKYNFRKNFDQKDSLPIFYMFIGKRKGFQTKKFNQNDSALQSLSVLITN
jgi:hypothetical protein